MRISDWSSDVCSSDLRIIMTEGDGHLQQLYHLNNGNDYVLFSEIAEIISDVLQERVEYSDSEAFWVEVMGARYVDLFGKDADEYYKQYYAFEKKFQFDFHRSDILERILGRQPKPLHAWNEKNGPLPVHSAAITSMRGNSEQW